MSTVSLLGYNISNKGLCGDVQDAIDLISSDKKGYMACVNPHSAVVAETDPLFKLSLKDADIILPDHMTKRHMVKGPRKCKFFIISEIKLLF